MRICPQCNNNSIRQEAKFCDMCGYRLPQVIAPPPISNVPVRPGPGNLAGSPPRAAVPPAGPRLSWKDVERFGELPDELNIDGARWVKIDELEPRNRDSENLHNWSINDTKHIFQERGQKQAPDGKEVNCRGYLHKGGFARFTIRNIAQGAPVAIVRTTWAEGRENGEIFIGEYTAGRFSFTDLDIHRPIRNRVHLIPRSVVTGGELIIEQEDQGSDNGLYYFGLKFYQPGDAVDALSSELARVAATGNVVSRTEGVAPKVLASGVTLNWEAVKKLGRGLPERMKVLNKEYELIDFLAFDKKNMDEHSFVVYEAENYFLQKLKASYPDAEVVEDAGIRWDSGYAEWTVGGTLLNRDLAIIIRTDIMQIPGPVEVLCDERSTGLLQIDLRDPVNRWRNWNYIVPAKFVSEGTAHLRFQIPSGSVGMNMYRLWFYQSR